MVYSCNILLEHCGQCPFHELLEIYNLAHNHMPLNFYIFIYLFGQRRNFQGSCSVVYCFNFFISYTCYMGSMYCINIT